jgi:hypothetical protein
MNTSKIKRRLREAERIWRQESQNSDIQGMPGYVPGVLKGFKETLRILEQYQKEELNKAVNERHPLSRWTAIKLYHACRQAYGRLRYSDRRGAMKALKRAMDRIQMM